VAFNCNLNIFLDIPATDMRFGWQGGQNYWIYYGNSGEWTISVNSISKSGNWGVTLKPADIIGVAINFDDNVMTLSLNGSEDKMGILCSDFTSNAASLFKYVYFCLFM
jgi:hypothetical protein